ncbi:hypothetical protein TNCV_3800761 [Trichonephila clavipes]|nr:hypothetical protein TNCV_3800761 [Trichonephila clavipes]
MNQSWNIIIGSKDYEEEFVRDQLSVILEERFDRQAARNRGGKNRQAARNGCASELNELRLKRSKVFGRMLSGRVVQKIVRRHLNYRISIGRAEEYVRETSPAVLMAEATIPVTTLSWTIFVYVKVKGEQEMVNASKRCPDARGKTRCCRRTKH